jgi:type II secretory pathway component PulC
MRRYRHLTALVPLISLALSGIYSTFSPLRAQAERVPTLELVGVGIEGASSWALINIGKEANVFNLGDIVAGSWKIKKIERRCVTVQNLNNHRIEEFCLSKGTGVPGATKDRSTDRHPGRFHGPIGSAVFTGLADSLAAWTGVGGSGQMVSGADGAGGFRVVRLGKDSFLASMGMREGDVLSVVNDVEIRQSDDLLSAVANVSDEMIEVVYTRDGEGRSTSMRLSEEMLATLSDARKEAQSRR